MLYEDKQVIEAFRIFSNLAVKGQGQKDDMRLYFGDDAIRGLVEQVETTEKHIIKSDKKYNNRHRIND